MKKSNKGYVILAVIIVALVIFMMMGPFYVINEGSQVVVTRFGKIVNTHTNAGLYFKVPFIDVVVTYPKLILSLDGDSQRIPTKENQFIIVDTTSRWRISDPEQFYQSFKTLEAANIRLSDIIDSATRTIITQNKLSEVVRSSNLINEKILTTSVVDENSTDDTAAQIDSIINVSTNSESITKGRRQLTLEMAEEARKMIPEYGIELIDVVPRQIKYSDEMTESVYNRMIKDRNQVAKGYRSIGEGKKKDWLGKLEKDKLEIESEAYKKAQEIKGQADAEASKIYAQAYSVDPEFYAFWQSLESYKKTIPDFDVTYSTDMDYFKYLYSSKVQR
ncbi:MAG: protease modulator HflC [Spirochaetaceae bacterium]|nr:protease modulator HflC [Spirochaetaceae bacterium]MBQ7905276.1 protease modulator HflC [Spirochaetaceae bacterium]